MKLPSLRELVTMASDTRSLSGLQADDLAELRAHVEQTLASEFTDEGGRLRDDLDDDEGFAFDALAALSNSISRREKAAGLAADAFVRGGYRSGDNAGGTSTSAGPFRRSTGNFPSLVPSDDLVNEVYESIRNRRPGAFEERATVTLTQTGGGITTSRQLTPQPRRIVTAVGLVPEPVEIRGWSGPKFGTETVSGATAEGATKPEFDAISKLDVVPGAFARWTDVTVQGLEATDVADYIAAHMRQIALDEDAAIQQILETEAGTPAAFAADVQANVRGQMAAIEAAVAAPCDIILVNPANYALFAPTTPANAEDVASHLVRFNGAVLYPTASQDAGFVICAALAAGARYVATGGVRTSTTLVPKTNVVTVLTEMFTGLGVNLAGSVKAVDVVTP